MAFAGPNALSFPKSARLLTRPQFLAVKERGRGFAEGPLAASWLARQSDAVGAAPPGEGAGCTARVGITVSAKVGNAVVRNRVKRRLREAVRHELRHLPAVDLVLVARGSAARGSVVQFRDWLRKARARIAPVAASVRAP